MPGPTLFTLFLFAVQLTCSAFHSNIFKHQVKRVIQPNPYLITLCLGPVPLCFVPFHCPPFLLRSRRVPLSIRLLLNAGETNHQRGNQQAIDAVCEHRARPYTFHYFLSTKTCAAAGGRGTAVRNVSEASRLENLLIPWLVLRLWR